MTGATGFVGNYVVESLLNRVVEVIATSSNIENAKKCHWIEKVTFIPYDITSNENSNLFEHFNFPDKIIHLAWKGLPNYNNPFHLVENLPNDFNFIRNLVINGAKDISITGTCFEYGLQEGCLDETMNTYPNNYYALAKDTLRKSLELFQLQHTFDLKWIRLFYMYGEGQNPNSLIAQLDKAIDDNLPQFNMSGGEQFRDYLPVSKVAENIVKIAMQKDLKGVINNCSGEPISVKNFVNQYLKDKNKKIDLNMGFYPYSMIEPMEFWGNNEKIVKLL